MAREAAVKPGQGRDNKEFAVYIQPADIRQSVQMRNHAKKDGYLYGLPLMIHPRYCFLGSRTWFDNRDALLKVRPLVAKGALAW
jgi:hypothetical protein